MSSEKKKDSASVQYGSGNLHKEKEHAQKGLFHTNPFPEPSFDIMKYIDIDDTKNTDAGYVDLITPVGGKKKEAVFVDLVTPVTMKVNIENIKKASTEIVGQNVGLFGSCDESVFLSPEMDKIMEKVDAMTEADKSQIDQLRKMPNLTVEGMNNVKTPEVPNTAGHVDNNKRRVREIGQAMLEPFVPLNYVMLKTVYMDDALWKEMIRPEPGRSEKVKEMALHQKIWSNVMDKDKTKKDDEEIVRVSYFIVIFTRKELTDYLRPRKLINSFILDLWNKRIMMKELVDTRTEAYVPRFMMETSFATTIINNYVKGSPELSENALFNFFGIRSEYDNFLMRRANLVFVPCR